MAKTGVNFCKQCGCNTEHSYVGKEIADGDYVAEAVFSLGLSLLLDPRKKCWKCKECGKITKK